MNTFNLPSVNEATAELIGQNAVYLIDYIYANRSKAPYTDPLIRVGLVLKTLLKSNQELDMKTLSPAIEDLTTLINTTKDDTLRRAFNDELKYLQSCSVNDDLISLNTEH